MSALSEGLQDFVNQVPEVLQPLGVGLVGMIPYVEGEGSAALGIIAGVNPIVAGIAGAVGNFLSVLVVVLLSSRARQMVVARRAGASGPDGNGLGGTVQTLEAPGSAPRSARQAKGQTRLRGWLTRFGVPGASLLAPLALPTQLTAAFFIASGVGRQRVLVWQAIAIILWTAAVAAAATGVLGLLGW
ncbi:small multidrug efflux protein [Arthrobacter zhaoguopingii]|uniref:small multidrug efflux protein n=1 Tax=Arthrobacter zhaoguopingii TaxID=2681491 RepID=UPI001359F6AA|nr:small multidrug efflux protein [Arthrobacter zhaoguopingii]